MGLPAWLPLARSRPSRALSRVPAICLPPRLCWIALLPACRVGPFRLRARVAGLGGWFAGWPGLAVLAAVGPTTDTHKRPSPPGQPPPPSLAPFARPPARQPASRRQPPRAASQPASQPARTRTHTRPHTHADGVTDKHDTPAPPPRPLPTRPACHTATHACHAYALARSPRPLAHPSPPFLHHRNSRYPFLVYNTNTSQTHPRRLPTLLVSSSTLFSTRPTKTKLKSATMTDDQRSSAVYLVSPTPPGVAWKQMLPSGRCNPQPSRYSC